MEELTDFDAAAYLDSDEARTYYLAEVAKENSASAMCDAAITVARSRNMTAPSLPQQSKADAKRSGRVEGAFALA